MFLSKSLAKLAVQSLKTSAMAIVVILAAIAVLLFDVYRYPGDHLYGIRLVLLVAAIVAMQMASYLVRGRYMEWYSVVLTILLAGLPLGLAYLAFADAGFTNGMWTVEGTLAGLATLLLANGLFILMMSLTAVAVAINLDSDVDGRAKKLAASKEASLQ